VQLGGLSILRGSHRIGMAPLEFALGPGNRQAKTDRMRLSVDYRFQR
jgi:hypothetical protein